MGMRDKTEEVAVVSTLVSLGLSGLKFLVYGLTGSVAMLADAVHSFTDSFTSALVLLGIHISKRKSATFPYGLYKVENLVSMFVSFAIFYAGYEILMEALKPSTVRLHNSWIAALMALFSVFVSWGLSVYKLKVGRKYNSPSLIADGYHSRSDALSSIVVLLGILFGIDRIAAIVVVILVVRAGFEPLIDSLKVLLDASIEPELLIKVKELLESDPRVVRVKSLKGRNSGRYRFIEAVIELNVHSLDFAHKVSEELESRIKAEIPNVDQVLIHYEPSQRKECIFAIPVVSKEGSTISDHFSGAPFFMIVRTHEGKVTSTEIVENPFTDLERHRGPSVGKMLAELGVTCVIVRSEPPGGSRFVLEGMGIEMITTDENDPMRAVEKILANRRFGFAEKG